MTVSVDNVREMWGKISGHRTLTTPERTQLAAAPALAPDSSHALTLPAEGPPLADPAVITPPTPSEGASALEALTPLARPSYSAEVQKWGRKLLALDTAVAAGLSDDETRQLVNGCWSSLPPLVRLHSPNEQDIWEVLHDMDSWNNTTSLTELLAKCPGQVALMVSYLGSLNTALDYLQVMYNNNPTLTVTSAYKPLFMPPALQRACEQAGVDPGPIADMLTSVGLGRLPYLQLDYGVNLIASDFTLTGWGSGASVSSLAPLRPNLNRFQLEVTAGSSPSANPTVKLAMSVNDRALVSWTHLPIPLCQVASPNYAVAPPAGVLATVDADFLTMTLSGSPEAGKKYVFTNLMVG